MNQKSRILILTADAGFGHRSAANAVSSALMETRAESCECTIINPVFTPAAPFMFRKTQTDYDKTVRNNQAFYEFTYRASDSPAASSLLQGAMTLLLYQTMQKIIEQEHPDAVLSTFEIYNAPMKAALANCCPQVPLFSVITDLADVHQLWLQADVEKNFVPTGQVLEQALAHGIPAEKLVLSGIPIHPRFAREQRSKAEIRAALGWQPDIPTLLAVGSRRINPEIFLSHLDVINRCRLPLQLAVVAGGDDSLHNHLLAKDWRIPVHLYNYVENIPDMMHAADILISKAGGLIITEGLACGLPILLVDNIPGQETGNIQFVCENRAGVTLQTPVEMQAILHEWLSGDPEIIQNYAAHSNQLGKPDAAYRVAEILWQAAYESSTCRGNFAPITPSRFGRAQQSIGKTSQCQSRSDSR